MNMAIGWHPTRLGELVAFKTGKLDSNAAVPGGRYPFFTCSQETFRTNTYSFDTECVLLAGNNANGIFPLKYFKGKFDAYQRTYVLTPRDPRRLVTKFLYYALRPKLAEFRSVSTGAATKFLTMGILNETEIQIPTPSIQRRIASILGAYDDLIEVNRRRIAVLEEMARRLFDEWFVNFRFPGHEGHAIVETVLGKAPSGWTCGVLGDLLTLAYGKGLKADTRIAGDFPVIGSSGVVGTHNESLVDGPAIIVGRKGNVGSVIWSDAACYPIDTVFYVETWAPLRFVYQALKRMTFLNSDAAVPGLNRAGALRLDIIIPPTELMDQYQQRVSAMLMQATTLSKTNDRLSASRDLLLPRLISGELPVATAERELEDAA